MRHPSVVSLSLSFALSRADDDDGKKISTTQRKEIYIKISFEFKKITPRPRRKGVSRANYIAPRHHHHHHHHHSRLFKVARAAHTHKKKRTFIGAAGIFAPLKDDDLFADDEDGARIVASGWTVSVEDNILYICNSSVCSCVRLNLKNLFYFVFVLSLSLVVWQSTRRGVLGVSWLFQHTTIFIIFIIFIKLVPKFSRTTRGKIFKNRQTHNTHRYSSRERERKTPHERRRQREGEKMTTTTRTTRRKPVG